MVFLSSPTEASRKYVDLIYKVSSQWASWKPSIQTKVGDYGIVNKKTGLFEKEGNIYDDELIPDITTIYPPEQGAREDTIELVSDSVRRRAVSSDVHLSIPDFARASLKGQWEFGNKRGALLIMDRPQTSYIPHDVVLKHLVNIPILADKFLVTDVVFCHAFWSYLSTKNMDVVTLALVGSTPPISGIAVEAGTGVEWWNENVSGKLEKGCKDDDVFTPLFSLKKIRKPSEILFRDAQPIPPTGDDLWVKVLPPWDALDEEGNEEPFEDTIFYADDEENSEQSGTIS